jgi:hypothetical protein
MPKHLPEEILPNYSDIMHFLGNYYACGELGVIFEEKGFPNWLVKVVNQDAEDDENLLNMYQSQFFEKVWKEQKFRGLPKLKYFWDGECEDIVINHLTHTILKSKSQAEVNILDLDEGDLMSIWIMERLDRIGTDHSKPLSYTVEGVAEAAVNIWEDYGVIMEDLHEGNYGQRDDDSFVIFDPMPMNLKTSFIKVFEAFSREEQKLWFINNKIWVRDINNKPIQGKNV